MFKSLPGSLLVLSALLAAANVHAQTFLVTRALIDDLTVIQLSSAGHLPGNMEIKVAGGFTIPPGTACTDATYITTLKGSDPDKRMFALLTAAQLTKQRVTLVVSDDPALSAFGGRCSLVGVSLTQ